jgi:hypothetical protein
VITKEGVLHVHQKENRVEAHIFVSFLAYCLHRHAGTMSPYARAGTHAAHCVREVRRALQMIDVHLPTTDGREIILTRTTQPEPELRLLLDKLRLELPPQPPTKISAAQATSATAM